MVQTGSLGSSKCPLTTGLRPNKEEDVQISDTPDIWRKLAEQELRGRPVEDLTWNTLEGIPVQPLYTQADLEGLDHLNSVPGQAPYTRGVKATMYAGRPWTIRQYAGFSTA